MIEMPAPNATDDPPRDYVAYHASASASRLACVDLQSGARLTYAELDDLIARCAGYLETRFGPASGIRVAVLARNSVEIIVLHFACVRAGCILQPLNWRLTGTELRALVRDAEPSLFFYQDEFAAQASQAWNGPEFARVELKVGFRVIAGTPPAPLRAHGAEVPITLLYTSGTTGRPKGVVVTARNAWATALNFTMINEIGARDVLLCDMPMFHVAGLFAVVRSALFAGGTVLISDRFSAPVTLARLSDSALGVTHCFAIPQMVAAMMQDGAYATADLRRLKALVMGGAPLPKVIVERLLADRIMPAEGYGLSEAGTVFGMPLDRATVARKAGACGLPAMMIDVRLVDENGHDVADNEIGEIWLKGPSVTPGYWNQPDTNVKVFQDGWFKTGDAAVRDADGFYRIVDRWKDMYITGGENVYPAEVEAVLAELPEIAEAAVIGVRDGRWGESGCAYVVLRPELTLTAERIIEHCRSSLAGYKVPKQVHFVDVLPRSGSGKIKKDELRREYAGSER